MARVPKKILILRLLTRYPHTGFSAKKVGEALSSRRGPAAKRWAYPTLKNMSLAGLVEEISRGQFRITALGAKEARSHEEQ